MRNINHRRYDVCDRFIGHAVRFSTIGNLLAEFYQVLKKRKPGSKPLNRLFPPNSFKKLGIPFHKDWKGRLTIKIDANGRSYRLQLEETLDWILVR